MNKTRKASLIRENLVIAFDVIWSHKLRSGLIVLGVAIGVASLMGMVSILLGLNQKIRKDISSSEQTVLMVMKFDFLVHGDDPSVFRRRDITVEDALAIRRECKSLQSVTFLVEPQGRPPYTLYRGSEKSRMIQIVGSEPSLFNIWNLELEEGRMFSNEELFHTSKVVVLGRSPRRDLFPSTDPIGKKVRIGNDEFTVVGTFVERKTLFGSLGENFAMIPYTTYMSSLWREYDMQVVYGAIREGTAVEKAKDEVIRVMRVRRKLKANQDNDFAVNSSDAAMEFLDRITAPVAGILAAISSIGLLVGGIGVMNMMLVSVTERTGEIGIRKAVGAKRQDIMWQFLMEAGALTGLGGVFGIIAGLAGALIVSALTGLPSSLSPFYIILAVLFSIVIGMFFGLYPANRAARQSPVAAMGYAK
jgi:putative ABC transport system permease protein